jgi:hypothetical protein
MSGYPNGERRRIVPLKGRETVGWKSGKEFRNSAKGTAHATYARLSNWGANYRRGSFDRGT